MAYVSRTSPTTRLVGIGSVVVFHLLVGYALVSGLARTAVEVITGPIQVETVAEVDDTEQPPPPPPPPMDTPDIPFVPPPEIAIDTGAGTSTTAITATTKQKTNPKQDPRRPNSRPEYPTESVRLGEAGSVVLSLLVGADGRVQDGKIQTSSGYPRLDNAALQHMLRTGRFVPGTEDGKPAPMWFNLRITFRIEDARR